MANVTNGFTTRRVTLTANTEQVVLFPGGATEVDVALNGWGPVSVATNQNLAATTDTGAIVLGGFVRAVKFEKRAGGEPIASIALYSAFAVEVQWTAK